MRKIYVVGKNQFNNEEESLYKKYSLSEFDSFIAKQKAEVECISVQSLERIESKEGVIIFRDVPLLEAEYQASKNKLSQCYKGVYIDAENIEGFRKFTKAFRNASYIPFDFIIYSSNNIKIGSICSIEIPKYEIISERTTKEMSDYNSTTLWKFKSRTRAKETSRCIIIHPNNLHGWNTRQVVKDTQYCVHMLNEIVSKLKNVELSLMIDSSRYISIPEMSVFNKLYIAPKLINPIDIEETLYSSDLILFVPSAYKCHSNYKHIMDKLGSEYKCEVITLSQGINKNKEVQENTKTKLLEKKNEVVEWVKQEVSTKIKEEYEIRKLYGRLECRRQYEGQIAIFISNEINNESRSIDGITRRENFMVVDWLMREVPQNDIWIISGQVDFLSISKRLYERIKQFSICEEIQENKSYDGSFVIKLGKLSEKALKILKKVISLRESLSNYNTNKASNIEKLLYETNRYVIKDILIEICPSYCMIADANDFLIDKTIWWS